MFQYWPTRGTETYGVMCVTLTDTQELATYVIRTFQLQRVSSAHVRSFTCTFFRRAAQFLGKGVIQGFIWGRNLWTAFLSNVYYFSDRNNRCKIAVTSLQEFKN